MVLDNVVLNVGTDRANKDGHKVEYYGELYLYIDGEQVWECRANIQGNWSSNTWKNNDGFRANRALPFMAHGTGSTSGEFSGAIEYNGVTFVDLDTVPVKMTITGIAASENAVYIALSDVHWVCGTDFRRNVSPVADPVDRTIVLDDKGTADPSDDVTCSGKIWYVFDN